MTPRSFALIVVLALATPALAQDRQGRQRDPGAAAQSGGGGTQRSGGDHQAGPRDAGSRNDAGRRERDTAPPAPRPAPASAPAPAPVAAQPAPARAGQAPADPDRRSTQPGRSPDQDQRQGGSRIIRVPPPVATDPATAAAAPATPGATAQTPAVLDQRSAQPRRDPGPDNRQAVPRTGPVPRPDGRRDDRRVVYGRPRVYNNYYYYPRRSYPYGYGAFGLGYFYYDPYAWGPGYYGGYYGYDPYYARDSYYDQYGRSYPTGELRLDVDPSFAEVYVDGYYAGLVDDFDGVFQSLRLEDGPHQIRIVAPGFAPLDFDVRIYAGRKVTYRGDLMRVRP